MGASASLKELSRVIGRYESDGGKVQRIEAETPEEGAETGLAVTLEVPVSLCPGEELGVPASPASATITDDGGLQVEFSPSVLPELDEYVPDDASTSREDARVTDDGTVVATFTLAFEAETEQRRSEVTAPRTDDSHAGSAPVVDESAETTSDDTESTDTSAVTTTAPGAANDARDIGEHEDNPTAHEQSTSDRTEIEKKLDGARNEGLLPYEDSEYLQCLYDSFDTFAEMAEHIEMDVSSETVRRYMTEAGIHEPSSYETSDEATADDCATDDSPAEEDASEAVDEPVEQTAEKERTEDVQSPSGSASEQDPVAEEEDPIENVSNTQLVADGIGLPDGLTIEELADAIESSMTLYDVQRQLDLDRDRAQEMLKRLNLLDLIMHRISHDPDQTVTREEIANRIRSSVIDD